MDGSTSAPVGQWKQQKPKPENYRRAPRTPRAAEIRAESPPPIKQPPKTTTKPGRTPKETSSGLWIPTFNPVVGTSGLSDFRDPSRKTYPKRPPTNTPHNLDQPGRKKLSFAPPDTGPLHSTRSWAPRPSRIPRDPSGKPHPKRPPPTRPQPRTAWSEEPAPRTPER
ncbi:uncharacterized protein LOC134291628 [Aedes albopictus]|uniref:Uncharacterized protein n=1 Tax=Aedes albopictus TaxID=7160 RepID=A0ABM1YPF2_AEDAL